MAHEHRHEPALRFTPHDLPGFAAGDYDYYGRCSACGQRYAIVGVAPISCTCCDEIERIKLNHCLLCKAPDLRLTHIAVVESA